MQLIFFFYNFDLLTNKMAILHCSMPGYLPLKKGEEDLHHQSLLIHVKCKSPQWKIKKKQKQ